MRIVVCSYQTVTKQLQTSLGIRQCGRTVTLQRLITSVKACAVNLRFILGAQWINAPRRIHAARSKTYTTRYTKHRLPHLLKLFIGVKSTVFQLRITRAVLGHGLLYVGWAGSTKFVKAIVHRAHGLRRHAVGWGRTHCNGHLQITLFNFFLFFNSQTRKQNTKR